MTPQQKVQSECEAVLALLKHRYGNRLTPEMMGALKGSVEAVVKTILPVRSVALANGDAPLLGFTPYRKEG